ncbi:hypothetical protein FRC20_008428 [Serendipita sp. 405]|nr:hypothetical protein FRC15_008270 [Serendipita sp. 397]KAG8830416.1 hypothetical protein FRC20_008428 [Serendipita sp. 405]
MASPLPTNFYKTELSRALKENSFGLKGYQLLSSGTPSDVLQSALARVELLDGLTVYLRLTYVGYEIIADPANQESQSPQMEISETLDELLRAVSPAFNSRYSERLMTRLNQLVVH